MDTNPYLNILGANPMELDSEAQPNASIRHPKKILKKEANFSATIEQRRAVERAQNAARKGRGKKKSKRRAIRFEADEDLVRAVEELHFALGRTKNDLYNEALSLLIAKYTHTDLNQ